MSICVRSRRVNDPPFNDAVKSVYSECLREIVETCPEPVVLSVSHCATPITWFSEYGLPTVRYEVSVAVTWRRPS